MNYYNPYTGSGKKKLRRRITVVIVSVLVIIGGTIVFGNHLKEKARLSSQDGLSGIGREDIAPATEEPLLIPPSEGGSGSSESVRGVCVPLGQVQSDDPDADEESFEDRLNDAAEGNSGVLIPLTGDDGYLLYNSARAAEASRVPANPDLPDMEDLAAAVSLAKAKGLRVTALIRSGVSLSATETKTDEAIAADQRIAADAEEVGFDELIIISLVSSPEDITGETFHVILRYLNQMTPAAGDTEVGLSLPPSVYQTATLSPQIELLASRSVFLTMELTAEQSTAEHLNYICENLAGTMSVYNMRMLLSPADTSIGKSLTDKLTAVGHENYLYITVPAEPPATDEPVTDGANTADSAETEAEA